ncbi:MAG: AcrR family transcriptional regulator [Myxococcota bacterium]|jgi:AcrR family transcriptional regulator
MPKVVDHEARRLEILERCFGLFAEQGYAALSMRSIARALGFSTGTLYYYFDSKEAIFEEMVRRVASHNVEEASAETPSDASRAERLAGLMRFIERNAVPLLQTLQVSLEYRRQQGSPVAQELLRSTIGLYRTALIEQLNLTESEGAVALSFLLGALVQHHLDPDGADIPAHFSVLGRLLSGAPG